MSLVIPQALTLVHQHLEATAEAERGRLAALRASFDAYVVAREAGVVASKLHAWGIASEDGVEQTIRTMRSALDALLTCLDTELPRGEAVGPVPAPVESGVCPTSLIPLPAEGAWQTPQRETGQPRSSALGSPPAPGVEGEGMPLFPGLHAEPRTIAIFGGEVRREKAELAARLLGRDVVWFSSRQASQLARSLKRGRVAAVVLLQGLTGHVPCGQIRALCRQRGAATAFGDRAGTGDLRQAFVELESKLGGASRAA
jgi:hypothetical protein